MASKINLDFDFPQVDLPSNVLAWHNITEDLLNLYKQACKLKADRKSTRLNSSH